MKILFAASGTGTGTTVKGIVLREAARRNHPDVEIGLALGTDFPELIPASNSYTKTWSNRDSNSLAGKFTEAVNEFKPDKIVVCYNAWQIQDELAAIQTETHLLWRAMKNAKTLIDKTDFKRFSSVLMFEHPEWDYIYSLNLGNKLKFIAPFYSIYEDQLIVPELARAQLLELWDIKDKGLPLKVFAHNGASADEVDLFLRESFAKDGHNGYHSVFVSQQKGSVGRKPARPLAMYMRGIDRLVACAGVTTFYEWFRYKRPEATERFFAASRLFDPQEWRATVDPSKILWYNGSNGADMLLENLINAS